MRAAHAGVVEFVEELGLTLDAITDASVGTSVEGRPSLDGRFAVMFWARFQDQALDRRSRMTIELARNRIILEGRRFSYGDLDRLFEDITCQVVGSLFAERRNSFPNSFGAIPSSALVLER